MTRPKYQRFAAMQGCEASLLVVQEARPSPMFAHELAAGSDVLDEASEKGGGIARAIRECFGVRT